MWIAAVEDFKRLNRQTELWQGWSHISVQSGSTNASVLTGSKQCRSVWSYCCTRSSFQVRGIKKEGAANNIEWAYYWIKSYQKDIGWILNPCILWCLAIIIFFKSHWEVWKKVFLCRRSLLIFDIQGLAELELVYRTGPVVSTHGAFIPTFEDITGFPVI